MFVTETGDCIAATEGQSRDHVAVWLAAAGLPPDPWPLDTADVATVLSWGGYDVDEAELRRLGEMGHIPRVGQWDAKEVLAAAACLDGRRQWRHGTPHDQRKHPTWMILEKTMLAGPEAMAALMEKLKQTDLRMSLILLAESGEKLREKIGEELTKADVNELRDQCEKLFSTVAAFLFANGISF